MTPIAKKSLGIDQESGLEQQIVITQLTIDSTSEIVVIVYRLELLSPKGTVVRRSDPKTYTRYNLPNILYKSGDVITPEVLDVDGVTVITPAVISDGTEVKLIGNMKFDLLRNSPIGQGITGLIGLDINAIKGADTLEWDLSQNDYDDLNSK